jgi:hypothetical protein
MPVNSAYENIAIEDIRDPQSIFPPRRSVIKIISKLARAEIKDYARGLESIGLCKSVNHRAPLQPKRTVIAFRG